MKANKWFCERVCSALCVYFRSICSTYYSMLAFGIFVECVFSLATAAAHNIDITIQHLYSPEWIECVCVCENDWSGMTEIVRHAIEDRIYFIITYNSTLAWLSFSWNQQSQSQSLSQNCFQQLTTDFKATIEAWRTQPLYHSHKTVYSVFSLHTETDRDTHHFAYNRKWQR